MARKIVNIFRKPTFYLNSIRWTQLEKYIHSCIISPTGIYFVFTGHDALPCHDAVTFLLGPKNRKAYAEVHEERLGIKPKKLGLKFPSKMYRK